MVLWHVVLYTVATGLALRSFVSLMAHHRQHYKVGLLRQAQQEARAGTGSRVAGKPESTA